MVDGVVPGLTEVLQAVEAGPVPLDVGIAIFVDSLLVGILIGWLVLVVQPDQDVRDVAAGSPPGSALR